jgi:hypothetical protein
MLTNNTNGTASRNRCINRSLLALATLAAFSLIAPTAQAAVQSFAIDNTLSSLKLQTKLDLSASPTAPQILFSKAQVGVNTSSGGNTTGDISRFVGTIKADVNPGTIELLNSSSIVADSVGSWAPNDPFPGPGDPLSPPNSGFTNPANYGIRLAALISLVAENSGQAMTFGAPASPYIPSFPAGIPTSPMPLVAGSFSLTGQAMSMTAGRQAFTSAFGNDTNSIVGFPTVFSTGAGGPDVGTLSLDGLTLTIPVHSEIPTLLFNDLGFPAIVSTIYTGVIVAHLVPEPSSIVMLGFGVVGMLAYGMRARSYNKKNA